MTEQDEPVRTQVRFPRQLHEELKRARELSGRSLNAEIVHRLEQSFEAQREADPAALQARLDSIDRRLESLEKKV